MLDGEGFPLPVGQSCSLPHQNKWLQTHFVLLAQIIPYDIF